MACRSDAFRTSVPPWRRLIGIKSTPSDRVWAETRRVHPRRVNSSQASVQNALGVM